MTMAVFSIETRRRILEHIIAANALEEYLSTTHVGQERFSLEGGESLIPLLDELIRHSGKEGLKEIVIGMAHRGRLNVLVNILGKRLSDLLNMYEGIPSNVGRSGDVIYNLGDSADITTPSGVVHASVLFNPSHLEIINPVVEGAVRARQEQLTDKTRNSVLPVLIHGDAAFVSQGVVMETIGFGQTRGYTTGGSIHIVINNQIGFTTSDPLDSRSTLYCTDIGKMLQLPILHVNGDDPEGVVFVTQVALDYRMKFNKDVIIDLVCYRRLGHHEGDEPSVTQPIMYERVGQHPMLPNLYGDKLIKEGVVATQEIDELTQGYVQSLEQDQVAHMPGVPESQNDVRVSCERSAATHGLDPYDSALTEVRMHALTERLTTVPSHFTLHKSVECLIEERRRMGHGKLPIDWGFAEAVAYAHR